jgi:hypothetical protein
MPDHLPLAIDSKVQDDQRQCKLIDAHLLNVSLCARRVVEQSASTAGIYAKRLVGALRVQIWTLHTLVDTVALLCITT